MHACMYYYNIIYYSYLSFITAYLVVLEVSKDTYIKFTYQLELLRKQIKGKII